MLGTISGGLTVRVAMPLVMLPIAFVTTQLYAPAWPVVTPVKLTVALVAPPIYAPFKNH